jgi:hypothetical protein
LKQDYFFDYCALRKNIFASFAIFSSCPSSVSSPASTFHSSVPPGNPDNFIQNITWPNVVQVAEISNSFHTKPKLVHLAKAFWNLQVLEKIGATVDRLNRPRLLWLLMKAPNLLIQQGNILDFDQEI